MRGGRGRGGRGGRGGAVSVTQDLVRDNLEDLGIDQRQIVDGSKPIPLFPNIAMQGPSKLTEDDIFCVLKMREITNRFQTSPYFQTRKTEEKDIKRYSDKYGSTKDELSVLDCINSSFEDSARYIPCELLDGNLIGGRIAGTMTAVDGSSLKKLQRLEQQELDGGGGRLKTAEEKKDGGGGSDNDLEDEMENEQELDDDYGVDHYASDNDNSGDDAEATF